MSAAELERRREARGALVGRTDAGRVWMKHAPGTERVYFCEDLGCQGHVRAATRAMPHPGCRGPDALVHEMMKRTIDEACWAMRDGIVSGRWAASERRRAAADERRYDAADLDADLREQGWW
jgi:hypothetical protein